MRCDASESERSDRSTATAYLPATYCFRGSGRLAAPPCASYWSMSRWCSRYTCSASATSAAVSSGVVGLAVTTSRLGVVGVGVAVGVGAALPTGAALVATGAVEAGGLLTRSADWHPDSTIADTSTAPHTARHRIRGVVCTQPS